MQTRASEKDGEEGEGGEEEITREKDEFSMRPKMGLKTCSRNDNSEPKIWEKENHRDMQGKTSEKKGGRVVVVGNHGEKMGKVIELGKNARSI